MGTDDVELGRRIGDLRRAAGLSQQQLANAAGIPKSSLGKIERGETSPTLARLAILARALGTTRSEIFAALDL